jgi:hypothetical protein
MESIGDNNMQEQFTERFAALHDVFESQPLVRLLLPKDSNDM